MSRLIRRKIEVIAYQGNLPKQIQDGQQRHEIIAAVDGWVEMGAWWDGEGSRTMLRVWTQEQQVFDLECQDGDWYIYKVWD